MRLLFAFLLFCGFSSQAQFGRKLSATVFAGTVLSSGNERVTEAGVSENIFAKYSPGPTLGGSIFYNTSKNLGFGLKLRYSYLSKDKLKVNNQTTALMVKWNFLPSDKKLSPYILGEVNYSLVGIDQAKYTKTVEPESAYSVKGEEDIQVTSIEYREPNVTLSFVALGGVSAGLGIDIRIKETVGFFVQTEYNNSFSKEKAQILKYFPNNKSNFSYLLVTTGLKFNLFKSKSLY